MFTAALTSGEERERAEREERKREKREEEREQFQNMTRYLEILVEIVMLNF